MNNREITHILKSHPYTRNVFMSTHAADTLPTVPEKRPLAYVANTHKRNQPGEHWVCFYFPVSGPREYFDSYGFEPTTSFAKFLGREYWYNKRFLQYPLSSSCGQYVIFFIFMRALGHSMETILKLFNERDLLANDLLINTIVEHNFNVDLDIFDSDFIGKQIAHSFMKK